MQQFKKYLLIIGFWNHITKNHAIIGGTRSEVCQWPWMVSIAILNNSTHNLRWQHDCGGSVITERWVLTAAHCVDLRNLNELRLYFGKHLNSEKVEDQLQVVNVSNIHIPLEYDYDSLNADIALIQTMEPIVFRKGRVLPVCLPEIQQDKSDERIEIGKMGTAIGWGITEEGVVSRELRHIQLPVISNCKCQQIFRGYDYNLTMNERRFCAGYIDGTKKACRGDSGGPFVFLADDAEDRWIQEGILSWGDECDAFQNECLVTGFTRIQRYMDWIMQYI